MNRKMNFTNPMIAGRTALTRLWWTILAVPLLASSALPQEIKVGLKGGIPLTTYFDTGSHYSSATRRYTVGVSAEWRFQSGIGLELDALYKRIGYIGSATSQNRPFDGVITTTTFDVTGNSWDIPLLVKYRFDRGLRPFVAGGGALRYIVSVRAKGETTVQDLIGDTTVTTPLDTADPFDLRKRVYPGFVVAGGIEIGQGRVRMLPEFRYTRWTANIADPCCGQLRLNPNQTEFLLGILF